MSPFNLLFSSHYALHSAFEDKCDEFESLLYAYNKAHTEKDTKRLDFFAFDKGKVPLLIVDHHKNEVQLDTATPFETRGILRNAPSK